jgi:hypothetical protein
MQAFTSTEHAGLLEPAMLMSRLKQVLTFAVEHLPKLPAYVSHWTEGDSDDVIRMEDKVVAESAILVLLASRVPNLDTDTMRLLDTLTNIVERAARSDRTKGSLLRCPHDAGPLGLAHVVLDQIGRGDAEVVELVRGVFAADLAETLERIPYRAMELRWVRYLLDRADAVQVDDLLPLSVAMKRVHPVTMSRTTGYGVTHAVMYATDFGALPPPPLLDHDELSARVDACASWALTSEDLDLLIEFIITTTLLRRPWSPCMWLAWNFFNSVWDELGFLPSPSFSPQEFRNLTGDAAAAYAFRNVYHTNYVGGLLCAILMSRDAAGIGDAWEPPRIPTDAVRDACIASVRKARAFLSAPESDDDGAGEFALDQTLPPEKGVARATALLGEMLSEHMHWAQTVKDSGLPPLVSSQILADAAITHAVRKYDLPKLLAALDLAMSLPARPSLTVVEGIAFLVRQQLPDGCIGLHFLAPEARKLPVAFETTQVICECLNAYPRRLDSVC